MMHSADYTHKKRKNNNPYHKFHGQNHYLFFTTQQTV